MTLFVAWAFPMEFLVICVFYFQYAIYMYLYHNMMFQINDVGDTPFTTENTARPR